MRPRPPSRLTLKTSVPVVLGLSLATACPAPPLPAATASALGRDPLVVALDPETFEARPELLARIRRSPHSYFRFVNVPFAEEVCRQFAQRVRTDPPVNLHGDAHLEQYAVSETDRGLADFDAATKGPAVLDLMRFAVSIRLAAHHNGFGDATPAMDSFLEGYEQGLSRPDVGVPEPALARRMRSSFTATAEEWLARMDTLMQPLSKEVLSALTHAGTEYATAMRAQTPELTASFFQIERAGALNLGIGSALEEKYLVRIQGPTPDPADDIILEAKQVPDLAGVSCIRGPKGPDPIRVILGQSRLGQGDHRLLGYLRMHGKAFFVQAWRVNYTELAVGDFESLQELVDVAKDVGVQLGTGHPKSMEAPAGRPIRPELLRILQRDRQALYESSERLSARVVAAWAESTKAR